ncbi:hypothetical protein GF322_00885 [Candidatus Dependentiae bacterium]|nr:hypothetical protein [Candidatus Dependentiae bacterium]
MSFFKSFVSYLFLIHCLFLTILASVELPIPMHQIEKLSHEVDSVIKELKVKNEKTVFKDFEEKQNSVIEKIEDKDDKFKVISLMEMIRNVNNDQFNFKTTICKILLNLSSPSAIIAVAMIVITMIIKGILNSGEFKEILREVHYIFKWMAIGGISSNLWYFIGWFPQFIKMFRPST